MGVPGDSCPSCLFSPFSALQSCHQQRPFLRDACSTEKEGLLHKETLRAHQGTASPGSCGPFSCLPLRSAAEPSRGEQRAPLPAPACSQRLSFSFRSFLSGRRVGSEGWGWRLLLPLLGAGAAPSTNRCQQQSSAAIPTPRLGGLTAAPGALSLPRSVPGQGPSPLLHRCL